MTRSYHGTASQAIEWVLHVNKDLQHEVFLKSWQEGDAEACWPEFYEWLDKQEGPKVGDGTGDAAIAIGEHAFRAGYQAAVNEKVEGGYWAPRHMDFENKAWDAYDPPEHIKELS